MYLQTLQNSNTLTIQDQKFQTGDQKLSEEISYSVKLFDMAQGNAQLI